MSVKTDQFLIQSGEYPAEIAVVVLGAPIAAGGPLRQFGAELSLNVCQFPVCIAESSGEFAVESIVELVRLFVFQLDAAAMHSSVAAAHLVPRADG